MDRVLSFRRFFLFKSPPYSLTPSKPALPTGDACPHVPFPVYSKLGPGRRVLASLCGCGVECIVHSNSRLQYGCRATTAWGPWLPGSIRDGFRVWVTSGVITCGWKVHADGPSQRPYSAPTHGHDSARLPSPLSPACTPPMFECAAITPEPLVPAAVRASALALDSAVPLCPYYLRRRLRQCLQDHGRGLRPV